MAELLYVIAHGKLNMKRRTCTAAGKHAAAPSGLDASISFISTAAAAYSAAAWSSMALAQQRELHVTPTWAERFLPQHVCKILGTLYRAELKTTRI